SRLALDDVELAQGGIAFLTVGQLARQRAAIKRTLAADQIARLACGFARPRRIDGFADNPTGDRRVLLEKGAQLAVDDRFDDALDFGVAKLGLGLPFELRMRNLDADDRGQTFADVIARDALLQI